MNEIILSYTAVFIEKYLFAFKVNYLFIEKYLFAFKVNYQCYNYGILVNILKFRCGHFDLAKCFTQ